MNSVLSSNDELSTKVILNALNSGADTLKILTDVFVPTINTINELYSRGRLNRAEKISFQGVIIEILDFVKYSVYVGEKRRDISALVVSGSEDTIINAKLIALSLRLMNCDTQYLGGVEGEIDPFFDIDFQRYVIRLWENKNGLRIVCVCSSHEGSLRFLYTAALELRNRLTARFILCLMTVSELKDAYGFEQADHVAVDANELLFWLRDLIQK